MATSSQNLPATDSATELHDILGPDATATFEDDPTFVDSNATGSASSQNLAVADDDTEEPEDEDLEDEDDDLAEDDEELDDDDVDDEAVEDDDEDIDDDEEDDEDDEDDDEAEDDAAEAGTAPALRLDGLLGYEDEADDVHDGLTEQQGNAKRARDQAALKDGEAEADAAGDDQADDDAADDGRENAVDEDRLNSDGEPDLDGDDPRLDRDETEAIHKGLRMLALTSTPTADSARA